MTACTTAAQWRAAIDEIKAALKTIPAQVQIAVAEQVLSDWQWTASTWSPKNPLDYWSGRYRGSITVSLDAPDKTALPPHPATIWGKGHKGQKAGVHRAVYWPDPVPEPYKPAALAELLKKIEAASGAEPVIISVTLPYAGVVEEHAHTREFALQSSRAVLAHFDWGSRVIIKI